MIYRGTKDLSELIVDVLFCGKPIFGTNDTSNGPIWYIAVLILCYVFAFILTKISAKYNTNLLFIIPIIIGIMTLYSSIIYPDIELPLFNYRTSRGLIAFFVGVYEGQYFEYLEKHDSTVKTSTRLVAFVIMVISITLWLRGEMGNEYIGFSFLVFPELILILYKIPLLERICSTAPIKLLGDISFGIYLWNYSAFGFMWIIILKYESTFPRLAVDSKTTWLLLALVHYTAAYVSHLASKNSIADKIRTTLFTPT